METLLITIVPSILILLFFVFSDKFREPKKIIIITFLFGILITIPAGYLNDFILNTFETDNKVNNALLGGFFAGGSISSSGYFTPDFSQFSGSNTASVFFRATDDWSLSSHPSRLEFQVCPSGSTSRANVMDVNGDSVVVNPTTKPCLA